jgi:hypothetical protein
VVLLFAHDMRRHKPSVQLGVVSVLRCHEFCFWMPVASPKMRPRKCDNALATLW